MTRVDACRLFLDETDDGEQRQSRTFPVQLDFPSPDESLLSYVARVGVENGRHFLSQVLRISFPDQLLGKALPFSGIDFEPLSRLLNVPVELLEAKRYSGPSGAPSSRKIAYLNGQQINRKFLSTGRRRIAPLSLAEHGYHRSIWDVLPLTCCVETGESLTDRCSCGKILTWRSNNLQHCGDPACRVDLREVTTSFVRPDQLRYVRFLANLYSPSEQERRAARQQIPDELSDLSNAELLELILLFGVAHSDPIGRGAGKRRMSLCNGNFVSWTTDELVVGIEVVLGYPASFEKLLDAMIERAPERPGRGSCKKYIGVLTELTEIKPFSARVVSKFRSYIPNALNRRLNVTLSPRVKTSVPKYQSTICLSDVRGRFGLSRNRIANLAKVPGLLTNPGGGRGFPALLDARKVDETVQCYRDLVPVTEAAMEVGLSLANFLRLVSDGFLQYADGPEVAMYPRARTSHKPASYLYRSRIRALFELIEAKARKLKEPLHLVDRIIRVPDGIYLGLEAIIEDKITVGVDTNQSKAMHRLLVEESEFRSYTCSKVPKFARNNTITLQFAAVILSLRWSVTKALLESSGVHTKEIRGRNKWITNRRVERFDVFRIAETYISNGATARLLGIPPTRVRARVLRLGVRPAVILEKHDAVFYHRQEIFQKCEHLFVESEVLPCGSSSVAARWRAARDRRGCYI